jgi:tRNA pseudouridine13 synthase
LLRARIRSSPSDFLVTEELGFEPAGEGEHDFLMVEKTGANTVWVARQLARYAGARAADVGFAGLKDRHAVTTQWFSVPRRGEIAWTGFECEGVRLLRCDRHTRKLRRGSHRGNQFRIALRGGFGDDLRPAIERRLQDIGGNGVPNYFGVQRFGHDGSNIALAKRLFAGERLRRDKRSLAISAARSFLFNEILGVRVEAGSWNRILPGEIANLDGSGSVFAVAGVDAELERRCAELDIHPTASLYGRGVDLAGSEVARIESEVLDRNAELRVGLEQVGAKPGHRPLRQKVIDLDWEFESGTVWLSFKLPRGGFATTVLDELADVQNERSNT